MAGIPLDGLCLATRSVVEGLSRIIANVSSTVEAFTRQDVGRVHDKVKELMKKRAILGIAERLSPDSENTYVMSPALKAFRELFGPEKHATGVVYIVYDEEGNGKTTAARALLRQNYRLASGKDIKGFMLREETVSNNIMQALRDELKANDVEKWMHILVDAMCQPHDEAPSILILDGVDSLGVNDINLTSIKELCSAMKAAMNVCIVVICQDKDVATRFCGLSNGTDVVPMPGFYSGDTLTSPVWSNTKWSRDLLIEMIHVNYPGEFSGNNLDFVKHGMTPLDVVIEAEKRLRVDCYVLEIPAKRNSA